MTRKQIDCRDYPGPCSLAISGSEAEVIETQAWHMVSVHGAADSPQLREKIRASLNDVSDEAAVR